MGVTELNEQADVICICVNQFLLFWEEDQGWIFFEAASFRSRSPMQIMNKYPAIGSPCLQPLPTLILGVGNPFIRMEDWKLWRRE